MDSSTRGGPIAEAANTGLVSLLGRSPDPEIDISKLRLLAADPQGGEVAEFCRSIRSSDLQRVTPLRELLHGLELVEPTSFWDLLDSRAVNLFWRSGLDTWAALCRTSICTIEGLRGAGPRVVEATISGMARDWADAYLRRWGISGATASPPRVQTLPAEHLAPLTDLRGAFERLEAQPGFQVFQVRFAATKAPTLRELAASSGRSAQAVATGGSRVHRGLLRQMRNPDSPITSAVRYVEARAGSLATPPEMDSVFTDLHRESGSLPRTKAHRRGLLLWLGDYLVTEGWVLSRDLEIITKALLDALVADSSADVDRVADCLGKLGVREHLQLPWLATQRGYRILDGKLVPAPTT
jgi:hypothetical protein